MIYPLVRGLAADGIPVTVTCRVLGFSPQAFYKWCKRPVCDRDWSDAHLVDAARQVGVGPVPVADRALARSEEHTSELQSQFHLVCRLLLEKKKKEIESRSHRATW